MFRFRLEKVLRYRSRQTEEQARRLRDVESEFRALESRRQDLLAEIRRRAAAAAETRTATPDIAAWRRQAEYATSLKWEADGLLPQIAEAAERVAEQRRILVEVHREEEVLISLKRSQEQAWRLEEARRERKEMDEVSSRLVGTPGTP